MDTTRELLLKLMEKDKPEISSILSVPEAGWTKLLFTKKCHELSYITCVPLDWLDAAIYGMKTGSPFTVHGDQESEGGLYCTVTYNGCYVVEEDDYRNIEYIRLYPNEFCKLLYKDISDNIDTWANEWDIADNSEESKRLIQEKLDELEGIFKKNLEEKRRETNQAVRDAMNGKGWGLVILDESLIDDSLIDDWHEFCNRREEMFEEKRRLENEKNGPSMDDYIQIEDLESENNKI
jgi:hypothetical protein